MTRYIPKVEDFHLGLRICVNTECGMLFPPSGFNQKWCPRCIDSGERRNILSCRWMAATVGRVCRWCGIGDHLTSFPRLRLCTACNTRHYQHGPCERCGRPKEKQLPTAQAPYCPRCFPAPIPEHYVRVRLLWNGQQRVVHKSPACLVRLKTKKQTALKVLANRGPVLMRVNEFDFYRGITRHPEQVKGLDGWSTKWEDNFVFFSPRFRDSLYDLNHFLQIGEADPLSFAWFWSKFCRGKSGDLLSRDTAKRKWDRLKSKLREFGIPYEQPEGGVVRLDRAAMASIASMVVRGSA